MSIFKKVSAFLTAVGIAAACTGCSDTTYSMTVDGVKVPAGIYIYYANSSYGNALSMIAQENPDLDTTDKKAVKAAAVEGVPVLQWIQDKTTELCVNYAAVEAKFDELGLELDAEAENTIDSMMEYYWAGYEETMIKNGVSEESFRKVLVSSYKSEEIFDYYYGIDGEKGVTEDQLKEYYLENNIRTQYVAFKLVDGEGNMLKSDGKADMMDMVEEYQDRVSSAYKDGGVEAVMSEMNLVQEEYNAYCTSVSNEAAGITETTTETTTAAATTTEETTTTTTAEAASDETGTETAAEAAVTETDENGSVISTETTAADETTTETAAEASAETTTTTVSYLNERVVAIVNEEDYDDPADITYSPSEKVYKQLLDITDKDYGKPFIVEEDEVYYLVVRYNLEDRVTEEDLWNENQIYSVQVTMFGEEFDGMLEEWSGAMNVVKNDAAYKRYDPFTFDFE